MIYLGKGVVRVVNSAIRFEERSIEYWYDRPGVIVATTTYTNPRSIHHDEVISKDLPAEEKHFVDLLNKAWPSVQAKAREDMIQAMTKDYLRKQHGLSWGGGQ
jgi:hypothetical protein